MASCEQSLMRKPLADLRGGPKGSAPPLGVQILSISSSFCKKIGEILCWCAPTPDGWRPTSEKSWIRHWKLMFYTADFQTEMYCMLLDFINHVLKNTSLKERNGNILIIGFGQLSDILCLMFELKKRSKVSPKQMLNLTL